MKIKVYLCTLLCVVTLLSCQKDDNTPIVDESSSPINTNYLSFKDRNSFENVINSNDLSGLRTAGFKSLKEANDNLGIDNEFLQSVLSPEGEVQIGQWLFKLNGVDRTVKVSNPTTKAVIGSFTFDDDVLDLLEAGITSTPSANQRKLILCGESGSNPSDNDWNQMWVDFQNLKKINLAISVRYLKYGVYFELRNFVYNCTVAFKEPYTYEREWWLEPKCKGVSHEYKVSSGVYSEGLSWSAQYAIGDEEKIYASTRALHRWRSWIRCDWYTINSPLEVDANHGF